MASNRSFTTTQPFGAASGTDFDDKPCIQNLSKAAITQITVAYDTYIRGLTILYKGGEIITRGTIAGTQTAVILSPDEFITTIEGAGYGGAIGKLLFVTNKGTRWGPYGQTSIASAFVWGGFGPNMGLLYFTGNASSHMWVLKATFATYPGYQEPPRVVKYEKHVDEPVTQELTVLSKFAKNLMSPIVTLLVGADSTEFNVPENILCRLPFFRAALHGEFREAAEKKIQMPEDEPEVVSALIEFLYTGSYTYAYRPRENTDSDTPVSDLAEGSFHVGVYVVASKYDSQPLVDAAVRCFMYVLRQLKDMDVVLLWKTGYAKGLLLSEWENDDDLVEFKKGLAKLLKELFQTHREEMEVISVEYPALFCDFLRLVVSTSEV